MAGENRGIEDVNADKTAVSDNGKGALSATEWYPSKSPSETRLVVEQQPSTIPKRR